MILTYILFIIFIAFFGVFFFKIILSSIFKSKKFDYKTVKTEENDNSNIEEETDNFIYKFEKIEGSDDYKLVKTEMQTNKTYSDVMQEHFDKDDDSLIC